jgi:hypothetical protein
VFLLGIGLGLFVGRGPTSDDGGVNPTTTPDAAPEDTASKNPALPPSPTSAARDIADAAGSEVDERAANASDRGDSDNEMDAPPSWSTVAWKGEAAHTQAARAAERSRRIADGCPGVTSQAIRCEEPPCMVFFAAPDAPCRPLESWDTLLPNCPWPQDPALPNGPPNVVAAPIRCADGYVECVRAFVWEEPAVSGESYDPPAGGGTGPLDQMFHVGRRLTEQAPDWICEGDGGEKR